VRGLAKVVEGRNQNGTQAFSLCGNRAFSPVEKRQAKSPAAAQPKWLCSALAMVRFWFIKS